MRSNFDAEKIKRDLAEVERLQAEEVPAGVPMANWAMAWCLQDPLVSSVICGCKNPEQVLANAAAAELLKRVTANQLDAFAFCMSSFSRGGLIFKRQVQC